MAAVAEGVTVAAAVAVVVEAEISAEAAGVAAVDRQVAVPPEEAVMGVFGTQAAGLPLPEAPAAAAAALIAEAGRARRTEAALIAEAGPEQVTRAHGRIHAVDVRILAVRSKAGGRIVAEKSRASGRKNGQKTRKHAQIVATSVVMM